MPHKPETAPEVQAGTGVRRRGEYNAAAPVIIAGADPRFVVLTDEEFMLAYRPWQAEYMRRYRKRGG
jgi:hypothetical protein